MPALVVRSMCSSLRILILDGVQLAMPLPHIDLPLLTMASWRNGPGRTLPFDIQTVRRAAVLDLSNCYQLHKIWQHLQVRLPLCHINFGTMVSCIPANQYWGAPVNERVECRVAKN